MKEMSQKAGAPDDSGTHVWLVLMKAHRALERVAIRSLESAEVGLSDFGVLEVLLHKGPQPVNQIGRRVELTSGAITTAVDRLDALGLVAREAHPSDRRARVVCLTPHGKARAAAVFRHHRAVMDSAATALSKAERVNLVRLLKKLGMSAEAAAAASPKEK